MANGPGSVLPDAIVARDYETDAKQKVKKMLRRDWHMRFSYAAARKHALITMVCAY